MVKVKILLACQSQDCFLKKSTKLKVQFNMNLQCLTPISNLNICSLPFWNAKNWIPHSFYIRTEKKEKTKITCNAKPMASGEFAVKKKCSRTANLRISAHFSYLKYRHLPFFLFQSANITHRTSFTTSEHMFTVVGR